MRYSSKLQFPGTILHRKRGRIDLCKLDQKTLKELYDDGCEYVAFEDGDPPNEQPIVVKRTPAKKPKTVRKKVDKKKPEPPPLPDDSLEKGAEAPE